MKNINWKDVDRQLDEQIEKFENLKFGTLETKDDENRDAKKINDTLDSLIAKTDRMIELIQSSK